MPRIILFTERTVHDRVFDLACADVPDRDRGVRRHGAIAEVVCFISRPHSDGVPSDFSTIVFSSAVARNARSTGPALATPCENVTSEGEAAR
jgi:hypothetical protein